jgi:arginine/lysine/ornithine decarboxylase
VIEKTERAFQLKALIVDDELDDATSWGRASRALVSELQARHIAVVTATSPEDGEAIVISDAGLHAVLIDWTFRDDNANTKSKVRSLLHRVRLHYPRIPVFLMAEREETSTIPLDAMQLCDEFIWTLEDTATFIGGRITAAIHRYREHILGPMASALFKFAGVSEYSWHTPGHSGGTAFLKSPPGRLFYDYFGENLFRSDLSISVAELGSLLDHTGPIGESEKYAARVFGAHATYCVTNGSSTANRIILTASVARDQIVLCDRNCHKSIEHGLTLTGGIPVYLLPSRNRHGIIGPIHPERLRPDAIARSIAANRLAVPAGEKPVHCVITNSTYDGLCAKTTRIAELLDSVVDRLHFDEAWYAYARFNPLYRERFAMHGDPAAHTGPTVFATHSTHKVLAALSQSSFIHVREGRSAIGHARLNESFMMHSSTSPLYTIIASNDIATAMMDGPRGQVLIREAIQEAVGFRQMIGRIRRQFEERGEWFFETWNANTVFLAESGTPVAFEQAPEELLVDHPDPWILRPGDAWHGFDGLEDDFAMLDPIKVSIITPGIQADGALQAEGIPAEIVTAYLDEQGIQVEKTTDYTILFLFTIGITKGKWGTLVHALLDFKRDYVANLSLDQAIPRLVAGWPQRYGKLGLRDLAREMHEQIRRSRQIEVQAQAFSALPQATMTPSAAYQRLVHDDIELLPISRMSGRVVAVGVVPYPPGIPLLMPGECAGPADGPVLQYLEALETWDRLFPGFEHETHGVDHIEGKYLVSCLKHPGGADRGHGEG